MRAVAGHRRLNGFTLVELLIVVVILGILAGLAIPRLRRSRGRAYDAAAMADLRQVMAAQEAYFSDNQTYALLSNLALSTSSGVTLGEDPGAGGSSLGAYSLTAKHRNSRNTWELEVGTGTANEGKIRKLSSGDDD